MAEELMKQWHGGVEPPKDWDGRRAVGRHGAWIASDGIKRWTHEGDLADIIFYGVRTAPPTEAQVEAAARAIAAKLYVGDGNEWICWIEEARAALEAAGLTQ